jgi:hypothetical protein
LGSISLKHAFTVGLGQRLRLRTIIARCLSTLQREIDAAKNSRQRRRSVSWWTKTASNERLDVGPDVGGIMVSFAARPMRPNVVTPDRITLSASVSHGFIVVDKIEGGTGLSATVPPSIFQGLTFRATLHRKLPQKIGYSCRRSSVPDTGLREDSGMPVAYLPH